VHFEIISLLCAFWFDLSSGKHIYAVLELFGVPEMAENKAKLFL
jgi:hypothetical protein